MYPEQFNPDREFYQKAQTRYPDTDLKLPRLNRQRYAGIESSLPDEDINDPDEAQVEDRPIQPEHAGDRPQSDHSDVDGDEPRSGESEHSEWTGESEHSDVDSDRTQLSSDAPATFRSPRRLRKRRRGISQDSETLDRPPAKKNINSLGPVSRSTASRP